MIESRIKEIIQDLRPDIDFEEEIAFIEDGIFDSFDIVSLVSALDKKFDISIDGNKITPEYFNTIEDIAKLIKESKK